MNPEEARDRLLDAAERLFYERGVQGVGMDDLRAASGVSLKRLYQCFATKRDLVEAYLRRRDERWRASLFDHAAEHGDTPRAQLLALYDWLASWFAEPDFRGCAFTNSFGELGGTEPGVARIARDHKDAVREQITELTSRLGVPEHRALADQLNLLVEGAIITAAISGTPEAATHARAAADTLLTAAGARPTGS
ncbi:TetR/AcrR family transcriptional regulator [Streptomyces alkaliterrae]|uniref:TetR family transcriptional regulator n=1 Tax=Streptomyces alkaliterrae TaxID=2213162 RepID=A0A5P0YZD6_9ACTN|nr:TetR/AcrR family transcriptional regulator [Streptomyces alkaliterrae]MBB1253238.1 TetR/AcrR family transcriptional regulator [Streptomyces alkaliterrae]MBB1260553.1 TetR/AcrR family transcriptional regulator [Streptomyces alkaliterrae]MQS03869.1 TetR family transcriptional regulator [Streptomyces alkaliterrae]